MQTKKHLKLYLEEIKPKEEAKKNGNDVDAINYEEAASSNPELFIIDRENESVYPLYYNKITSEKSKCRYCPSTISTRGGSTSGLKKHLESRHKKMYLEEVKPKVEARKSGNDVEQDSSSEDEIKILLPNPFFKGTQGTPPKSTPQKRRLNDSDMKVISKACKKPRLADDEGKYF